jgi:hypothetical protein
MDLEKLRHVKGGVVWSIAIILADRAGFSRVAALRPAWVLARA